MHDAIGALLPRTTDSSTCRSHDLKLWVYDQRHLLCREVYRLMFAFDSGFNVGLFVFCGQTLQYLNQLSKMRVLALSLCVPLLMAAPAPDPEPQLSGALSNLLGGSGNVNLAAVLSAIPSTITSSSQISQAASAVTSKQRSPQSFRSSQ